MSRAERIALSSFAAAAVLSVTLRWWLPMDEAVYQWIQYHRTCRLERWAPQADLAVRTPLLLLIGLGLSHGEWRRPWRFGGFLLLFLIGAAGVELLKTGIERLRPNSIPAMWSGNSFPSGHVTGATMAATIAVVLIRGRDWSRAARWAGYAVAVGCVVLQAAGRLVNGSHWMSDVVASVLLGVAWVLAAGWLKRLPRGFVAAVLVVAALAFVLFDDLPAIRVRLPSAIDAAGAPLASVEFGTDEARADLLGSWGSIATEPIGRVAWAVAPDVGVSIRAGDASGGILKVTLRPATTVENRRRCAQVVVTVNEWSAPSIALTRGWREYHVEPPPGVIRPGVNRIGFHIATEDTAPADRENGGFAAFCYLKLFPRA